MRDFEYNERKLYEMVVYFLDAFRDDATLGRIKLAKLIYNSDFRAMRRFGRPITGATYIKDTFGHNPKQLKIVALDLEAAGDAREQRGDDEEPREIESTTPRRLILREGRHARTELFTTEELALLDEVIAEYRETPGIAMSDEAHKTLGWRLASDNEVIPYESVYLSEPTRDDLVHAERVARLHALDFAPAGD